MSQLQSIRTIAAATALCLGVAAASAQAGPVGPTPYLSASDSPFNGVSFTYFQRETLEDNAFNVPSVSRSASTVIQPDILTDSVDGDDGAIDGSGLRGHSLFFGSGATGITFTFDAATLGGLPTHAGIVWTDGAGSVTLTAFGPGMTLLGSIGGSFADGVFTGTTAEDRFLGWTDAGGILAFNIRNTSGGIEVDHLQYGLALPVVAPVPEPASLVGLAAAFAGLGLARRRRLRAA